MLAMTPKGTRRLSTRSPLSQRPGLDDFRHRIGQGGDAADLRRHLPQPFRGQPQAVEHRIVHPVGLGRPVIGGVGRQYRLLLLFQGGGHIQQRLIFRGGGLPGQLLGRPLRRLTLFPQRRRIGGNGSHN